MEPKIFTPTVLNQAEARRVAVWTQEAKSMLPKSEDEILGLFALGWSVLVQMDGLAVAHAAITFSWPDDWLELGAVVTDKDYRKKGYGHLAVLGLLAMVREKLPEKKTFALCNDGSLPIFLGFGGKIMNGNRLPDEVWGECLHCPNFSSARAAGKYCCDTPVDMTEVGK